MSADAAERGQSDTELRRLIGLPFDDPDDVVRAAVEQASVPALLMSMVHMTGDVGLLDELPGPYALIAMDLQGAMSEDDKNRVRRRAFEVIVDYRDRGCPPPFVPDDTDLSRMLAVVSAGTVPDEFLDYVAADLRFTPDDQPVAEPVSTPRQRAAFPVVVMGAGESGILAGIRLRQAGIPFTIIDRNDGVGGTWQTNRYPGCRVDIPSQYYTYSFEPADHWAHHYATQPEILAYLREVADRYDVTSHVRTGTEVIAADWDTTHSVWHVRVRTADGVHENLDARALICAVGQFSNATIPDVPGAESFPGPAFHTGSPRWSTPTRVCRATTGTRVATYRHCSVRASSTSGVGPDASIPTTTTCSAPPPDDKGEKMSERLAGRVALISGGARGMGASHVRGMVAQGARVVAGDILDDAGRALADEVGDAVRYVHLDVTRPDDWRAAVDLTVQELGSLDVLVNNAGIVNFGLFEDYSLEDWRSILDVNLTGVFLGIKSVVPQMKKQGAGSIINISSIEGLAGTMASHGYTASKFGVRGITKSAALELGPSGIRVNSIHPGLIRTPMTEWVPDDIFQTALGRVAEPSEVSALVVYLASDESSYSTGSEFVVDGGVVAGLAHKDFGTLNGSTSAD